MLGSVLTNLETQGKITKVPKSKNESKEENEVRITVTTFQQLHK